MLRGTFAGNDAPPNPPASLWVRFESHQPPHHFPSVDRVRSQSQGESGEESDRRTPMFAGYKPSLIGTPWDDWQDANLIEDFGWGCTVLAMSLRARRTEQEIEARLKHLGLDLDKQPKRKIRNTTWTRR
jgi:hypothetical protein